MNDKGLQLFFVTHSGFGFEEGVYTQEEIKSLPKDAHKYIMSIGVAESLGYVVLDHSKGGTINDLPIFAAPDSETGEIRKYRNVREGTIDDPKDTELSLSTKKIGNALRDKLQEIKQNSAEASLKVQIEAKKKELNTNKI